MWGIGGSSGWLDWEVMMRGKTAGNSMNYKDDMSMIFVSKHAHSVDISGFF